MLQGWRAARARCGGALRRRWSSTSGGKAARPDVQGPREVRSRTPGVTRIRRGGGDSGKDVEVDSTIARIIGSDWGDRRGQTVSLPMRIYWFIFAAVLANGAYTYFTGRDESFLVEKLRKKVDEKVGNVEEPSEFEAVATGDASSAVESAQPTVEAAATKPSASPAKKAASVPASSTGGAVATPPVSIFNARPSASPSPSPFFSPAVTARSVPAAPRTQSKDELQAQLNHLRARQQSLRENVGSVAKSQRKEIEHQICMIDVQKAELKQALKRL